MSGRVVGWAMEQRTGSPITKLVLVKLADNANDEGITYPAPDLIREHTELGQSTVYKHLTILENLKLAVPEVIRRQDPTTGKSYTVNGWRLAVPVILRGGKERSSCEPKPAPRGKPIPRDGNSYKEPSIQPSLEPVAFVAPSLEAHVERLRIALGETTFAAWFQRARFDDRGTHLLLTAKSKAAANWIAERFSQNIRTIFERDVTIDYTP